MLPPASSYKSHTRQKEILLEVIIFCFIIAGSILRLVWAQDMEWKSEEQWMFEQAREIATGVVPIPISGMQSSVRVPNPGMSVWCFALIAKFTDNPVAMVRWIQWLNILTIWSFCGFIFWQINKSQRAPWLWGMAIASVNPIAILFSRKIWTPDIIAPFCFLIFVGYYFRKNFWGSFLWGASAILMGQVQMGGFFVALGLLFWTLWHDYSKKSGNRTAWLGWLLGTVVGGIPLIPWVISVLLPNLGGYTRSFIGILFPKFYIQWITTALGVNLSYSLEEVFWQDFLREPLIFGIHTYLMVPTHLFLLGIGLYPCYQWLNLRKNRPKKVNSKAENSWLNFYLKALVFGVGGAFTLSAVNVRPYYITVVFPFIYIWLAKLYQGRVKMLIVIVLMQLFISITFLSFIHRTGGFANSDYGIVYRLQMLE